MDVSFGIMRACCLLAFGLLCATSLSADALRLSSGQVVEGRIVDESESVIVMQTRLGPIQIEKKDILEIERTGKDPRIARIPKEQISSTSAFAWSLVPFYSGFYQTDMPALGVPFAAATGYYGLQLLRLQLGAVRHTDWESPHRRTDVFAGVALRIAVGLQENPAFQLQSSDPVLYELARGYLLAPNVFRVQSTQSVKVGSKIYTKTEYAGFRRRTFYRFVGSGLVGGFLAFSYIKWFAPPASTAGQQLEFAGFYLAPKEDGSSAGFAFTF